MSASVSPGRSSRSRGVRDRTLTAAEAGPKTTSHFSNSAATGAGSGAVAFGFTVITGMPRVMCAVTWWVAANADCSVTGRPSAPAVMSTASVISPDSRRSATRAAVSLASGPDGSRIAAGAVLPAIWVRASTAGVTRSSPTSGASTTYTLCAP